MPELTMLPLARVLRSPANPRRTIDAFPADDRDRELCASVKEHGVLLMTLENGEVTYPVVARVSADEVSSPRAASPTAPYRKGRPPRRP